MEMDKHRITKVLLEEIMPSQTGEDAPVEAEVAENRPGVILQTASRKMPGGKMADTGGDKVVELENSGFETKRKSHT
jgi:hypothetical protein